MIFFSFLFPFFFLSFPFLFPFFFSLFKGFIPVDKDSKTRYSEAYSRALFESRRVA